MEHRLLRSFVTVAEELHFGRAAKRLNLTQPPLSEQIRKLEEELDVRLFDRTNRRVALTAAGEALLGRARHVLAETERAREEVARVARGEQGALVIGYTTTASYAVLPKLVRAYRRLSPSVRVELREMPSPVQPRALAEGRIDVGLACLPVEGAESLHSFVLQRDSLVVALPVGHRLARLRQVRLAQLKVEEFVGVDSSIEPGWALACERTLTEAGVMARVTQRADSKLALLGLVAAGLGICVLGSSHAQFRRAGIIFKPVRASLLLDLGLLHRDVAERSPAGRFVALARQKS
jgi:DNA-binding transcriptional LysR family regulator